MTAQTLPRLHTLAEVAERYSLSLRSLRERARRREFEHVLIGRERYLTDDQLAGFVAANTVESATESQRDADLAATRERVGRRKSRAARRPAA